LPRAQAEWFIDSCKLLKIHAAIIPHRMCPHNADLSQELVKVFAPKDDTVLAYELWREEFNVKCPSSPISICQIIAGEQ